MQGERSIGSRRARFGLVIAGGIVVSSAAGVVAGTSSVSEINPVYSGQAVAQRPPKANDAPAEPTWRTGAATIGYASAPVIDSAGSSASAVAASAPAEADRWQRKADADFNRWQAQIDADIRREQARIAYRAPDRDDIDRGPAEAGPQGSDAVSIDAVRNGNAGNGREGIASDPATDGPGPRLEETARRD